MGIFNHKEKIQTLIVEGMKCEHCANKVKDALKQHKVKSTVALESKMVEVHFDENKITLEQIKQIINDLGYQCL